MIGSILSALCVFGFCVAQADEPQKFDTVKEMMHEFSECTAPSGTLKIICEDPLHIQVSVEDVKTTLEEYS